MKKHKVVVSWTVETGRNTTRSTLIRQKRRSESPWRCWKTPERLQRDAESAAEAIESTK